MPEAVTTLRAELSSFARPEDGFALLDTFLQVAVPQLGSAVLDSLGLWLPDELSADRAAVQQLIDEIEAEGPPRRRFLSTTERAYDVADEHQRWQFVRLAYCSNLATVWSSGSVTTYFEVAGRTSATYWLPDTLKRKYFERLVADGWEVPEEWVDAVAKQPKAWWKRGRLS